MNPRRGSTMSGLGKHLRRVSLVSFEEDEETPESSGKTAARAKTSSASRRHTSVFGLYSIREVMSVIRLFWFLDVDRSDGITLDELGRHRVFFQKLGHSDILAVFHELDRDGNGVISLTELLRVCFPHAKQPQLAAMLTLAKVGSVEDYLENRHATATATAEASELNRRQRQVDRQRQELREIFELFDTNGDGRVTLKELLDGLGLEMNRDDEDDLFNFMSSSASSHMSLDHIKRMERARSGGITRADVERFYHAFDKDHDDLLDFDEFVELMETSSERLSLSASEATAEG
ncbi:hypothetical protein Poli38472_013214 [Pythium oligandrum]|uniref:EF-hand domain-containing protein n=1 Tax=Pythium oligandrum TaxID=41045 RepID=A0A8K1C2M7_PYTOL|nr:hypothetical protein Poli38472_013214 [Pythium oligandrum]|eukprot:TMW55323.1 hypothetical protein Poli38472_013214 [Pythium oligandrum]